MRLLWDMTVLIGNNKEHDLYTMDGNGEIWGYLEEERAEWQGNGQPEGSALCVRTVMDQLWRGCWDSGEPATEFDGVGE